MELVRVKDYREMTEKLLWYCTMQIVEKPDSVLSFTTGRTTEGLLQRLAEVIEEGLDVSKCVFLNLDEYVGRRDGAYSVYSFMHRCLYDRITVGPAKIDMPDAEADDKEAEIRRYLGTLGKYKRDIQLLGLGTNGHIGANEPGTPFNSTMFVADSAKTTIQATQELFHLKLEETPVQMYTMGFTEIMEAEHIILAASGKSKAWAVKEAVEGEITEKVPASLLRKHKNFTFIADEEAAALLRQH